MAQPLKLYQPPQNDLKISILEPLDTTVSILDLIGSFDYPVTRPKTTIDYG